MSIATMASSSTTMMRGSPMRGALLPEADGEAGAAAAALDGELREVRRLVQLLVHQRHRANAVLRLREKLARLGIFDRAGLQAQEARRDLQVVLHAVVDLAQKRFLLPQRRLDQLLGAAAVG